ncbi:hypothetical protein BWI17_19180 [Betaproteobacteria bacterium GR16-43]|nr:hypothetical protein BWI17_19180 [Betaproteobacteria bacterium GR16-43]
MLGSALLAWSPSHRLTFDSHGFAVASLRDASTPAEAARWVDVIEITAWSVALMYGEVLTLHVRLSQGSTIQLDEEMEGWPAFIEALPGHLPSQPHKDWEHRLFFGEREQGIKVYVKR